jgi:hypothetical protein
VMTSLGADTTQQMEVVCEGNNNMDYIGVFERDARLGSGWIE